MLVFENFIKKVQLGSVSFALFREPHTNELHFFMQDITQGNALPKNWQNQTGFYIQGFDKSDKIKWIYADQYIKISVNDFKLSWNSIADGYKIKEVDLESKTVYSQVFREAYNNSFNKAQKAIEKGELKKVVISRCDKQDYHLKWGEMIQAYIEALELYPSAFINLMYTPEEGLWFGVSPEVFLVKTSEGYVIDALAGSLKKTEDLQPEWGDKEKKEQGLVELYIESLLDDLGLTYQKSKTESILAGNLWHLRSRYVIDEINEVNALIAALHPTPAVCGMPKWDSMDFIVENESYDRGLYAGFWGPVNLAHQQGFQFYVNLRCVHWDGDYLSFFAGGGIVEDSNLDKEWEETQLKMKTIGDVLTL